MTVSKILLLRQANPFNAFYSFTDSVIKELDRHGIEWESVEITHPIEESAIEIRKKLTEGIDAVLTFNSDGLHNLTEGGTSIYDKYGVPFYNWIVDNPIDNGAWWSSSCKNFYILCMDRYHLSYIKNNFPHVRDAYFLPLGGLEAEPPMEETFQRAYDVVFSGSLASLNKKIDEINSYPEEQKIFIYDLIDYSIANPEVDINAASEIVLKDLLGYSDLGEESIGFVRISASEANFFLKTYFRAKVLKELVNSKINLHIFGTGSEIIGDGQGCTHYHEAVAFSKTADIFKNSKILLNVMPCFKDGTHDRISSGMLNKNLILTDRSKYLDEFPGEMLYFYDIGRPEGLAEKISEILYNQVKYRDWVERAYEYGKENYSWEKTVEKLIEIISLRNCS